MSPAGADPPRRASCILVCDSPAFDAFIYLQGSLLDKFLFQISIVCNKAPQNIMASNNNYHLFVQDSAA